MNLNTSSWFQNVKNNKHIFIYSVCGRSRSTFLQRIINSSNQAFILGEHHYLIDTLCNSIWTMMLINKALGINYEGINLPNYSWMRHIKNSNKNLHLAVAENSHDKWYPNAMGEMTNSVKLVSIAIGELLRPFIDGCDRFGFKEIRLNDINVLNVLKWIFPNAIFVFVFRRPDEQWASISQFSGHFDYSHSLRKFSDEYKRLATFYIDFHNQNPHSCLFVNEKTLLNLDSLEAMLKQIDIDSFQKTLLKEKVGASLSTKSRYFIMRLYGKLTSQAKRNIINLNIKKQGLFDIYNQLEKLEYSNEP